MLLLLPLLSCAYIDYKTGLIPNQYVIVTAFVSLIISENLLKSVISAFFIGVILITLTILIDGFGGGDIKLIIAYSLSTSFNTSLLILGLAVALCGVYGGLRKIKLVPFAPFLLIAHCILVIF